MKVLLVSVPAPMVQQTEIEKEYWEWHYALKARLTYTNLSTGQLMRLGESENQNVGLLSIASVLEANGVQIDYLAPSLAFEGDFRLLNFEHRLLGLIVRGRYDFVGFSAHTCAIPLAMKYAQMAKVWNPKAKTIIGGPHATNSSGRELDELLEAFDFVVRGKGEIPFLRLAQGQIDSTGISSRLGGSRAVTDPCFASPEHYPSPANHLMNIRELPAARVYTSLGCRKGKGKKCVFCADSMHTRAIVVRPIEDVIAEMNWLYHQLGTRYFYLGDENLFLDPDHTQSLIRELGQLPDDIIIGCQARVESVKEELLEALAKTDRCTEIQYGVESADQEVLNLNRKGLRIEQVQRICQLTRSYGINVHCYFLVGLPGETSETAELTIEMMEEMLQEGSTDFVEYRAAVPFPGATMWEEAECFGVHIRHRRWEEYRGENVPPFDLDNLTAEQIYQLYLSGLARITEVYQERYRREFGKRLPDVKVLSAVVEGSF